jgi:hypothetical protein
VKLRSKVQTVIAAREPQMFGFISRGRSASLLIFLKRLAIRSFLFEVREKQPETTTGLLADAGVVYAMGNDMCPVWG